jgi:hypothetical protein
VVQEFPKFSCCAAGSSDMLPRQLRIAFVILIFECAEDRPAKHQ